MSISDEEEFIDEENESFNENCMSINIASTSKQESSKNKDVSQDALDTVVKDEPSIKETQAKPSRKRKSQKVKKLKLNFSKVKK